MDARFTSLFILAGSLGLLFFWFRLACRLILARGFAQDYFSEVAGAGPVRLLTTPGALQLPPGHLPGAAALLHGLEMDYAALTYLLRKTAASPVGHFSSAECLLTLDFHLLRAWLWCRRKLTPGRWGSSLQEMAAILAHLGNLVGERLHFAAAQLETVGATPAGSDWRILSICDYCKDVQDPKATGERWVTAAEFHEHGQPGPAVLSHGVCPQCNDHILRPRMR